MTRSNNKISALRGYNLPLQAWISALARRQPYGRLMTFALFSWTVLSLLFSMAFVQLAHSADVILNEYNAVPKTGGFLNVGKEDSRFGRREGNGDDWFEVVVVTDHLDMRGWQFVISNRTGVPAIPGPGEETFTLTLTDEPVWADLRSGTIITVAEDIDATAKAYRPEIGEWWINVRANDTASGKYITAMNFAVSNENTQFTILDALGAVAYGPSGEGISPLVGIGGTEVFKLEATPTGAITPSAIEYTDGSSSSFGLPNPWTDMTGPQIQDFSALRAVVPYFPLTSVVINEVNSHSDLPEVDWIELFNTTAAPIDIGGWFISDGAVNLMQYQIPPGTMIPANGYFVVLESSLPFSFDGEVGEAAYLSEGDGFGGMTGGRDSTNFGPVENGVSFGRFPNGSGPFFRMSSRTQGGLNSTPDFGPVVINEIMYKALGPFDLPLTGSDAEFIELRNGGIVDAPMAVDYGSAGIFPWRVSGGPNFDFPPTAVVPAQGFALLVTFDPVVEPLMLAAFRSHYGLLPSIPILGPSGGRLDNYTDSINLRRPDEPSLGLAPLVLRDSVTYFDFGDWPTEPDGTGPSLERIDPDVAASDSTRWAASLNAKGTPGAENSVVNVPEPAVVVQQIAVCLSLSVLLRIRNRRPQRLATRPEKNGIEV